MQAMAFRKLFDRLHLHFNIYAIDMPGFGRSIGPQELYYACPEKTIDLYCDCFSKYIKAKNIGKARASYRLPDIFISCLLVV